ncbi:MAG: hypothetical protein JXQ87_03115 [Bacteroidia bacterium]
MKKRIISALILNILGSITYAQSKLDFKNGIGYETNIFKNPSFYFDGNDTLERWDMYQNGFFYYSQLRFSTSYKTDRFYYKLKSSASTQQFFTNADAHSYRMRIEAPIRYKLGVNKYLRLVPQFATYRQNGVDQRQGAIRTPLSFSQMRIPLEYERRKSGYVRRLGAFYQYKDYPTADNNSLMYNAVGTYLNIEKEFSMGKNEYKVFKSFETHFRKYYDVNYTGPVEVIDDEGDGFDDDSYYNEQERDWFYVMAEYKLRKYTANGYVELPLRSFTRLDFSTQKYGYTQHDFGIRMKYKNDKISLSVHPKIAHRYHFKLKTNEGANLQYFYTGIDFRAEMGITEKISLGAQFDLMKRFSNNQRANTLAFREYFNYEALLTLRYRIF